MMFRRPKHEYYGRPRRHRRKVVNKMFKTWAKQTWPSFGWVYCWPDRMANTLIGADLRHVMVWPKRAGANFVMWSN